MATRAKNPLRPNGGSTEEMIDITAEDTPTRNLYQKLNDIKKEFGALEKDGTNSFHKYNYVTEAQVMQRLKDLCVAHGVFIAANCTDIVHQGELTTIKMVYTIINADSPNESFDVTFPGTGTDKGDKGLYKAMTGSYKYFSMKTFQLAVDDSDPENDSKHHEQPHKMPKTGFVDQITSGAGPTFKPGPVRQQMSGNAAQAREFIYSNNGIALTKPQFEEFKNACKSNGFNWDKDHKRWVGHVDLGPNFEQFLVGGRAEAPESPAQPDQQGQLNYDTDEIPF